jgi:hypothetical protein
MVLHHIRCAILSSVASRQMLRHRHLNIRHEAGRWLRIRSTPSTWLVGPRTPEATLESRVPRDHLSKPFSFGIPKLQGLVCSLRFSFLDSMARLAHAFLPVCPLWGGRYHCRESVKRNEPEVGWGDHRGLLVSGMGRRGSQGGHVVQGSAVGPGPTW